MHFYRTAFVRSWLSLLFIGLLSAPSLAQQSSASDAENTEQGAKLMRAAIEARGGNRYLSIKTLVALGQYTPFKEGVSTSPVSFEDTVVYPDKERVEFGRGKKKDRRIQVNVGGSGWVYDGNAETLKDQTAEQVREFLDNLIYDLDHVLRNGWQAIGVRTRFFGREETRPGERADVIEVQLAPERKLYIWLDRFNHLPISLIYEKDGEQGLTKHEYRFFQYVAYDGVKFPNIVDYYRDGRQISRINYQEIKLNVPVVESIFNKPVNAKAIK